MHSVAKKNKKLKRGPFGTLKIFEKKSHSAKKIKRGDTLVSAGFVGYVKNVKNERGDPLETKKVYGKTVAQCRKKIERGDSLVPSGFVSYLEKVKK